MLKAFITVVSIQCTDYCKTQSFKCEEIWFLSEIKLKRGYKSDKIRGVTPNFERNL